MLLNLLPLTATDVGLVVLTLVIIYVIYSTRHFGCFKDQGIAGPRPWPLFGNVLTSFKMGRMQAHQYWTEKYGKICGIFIGSLPTLMTSDPDMLKSVLVKDFAAFHNRPNLVTPSETFSQTLVALRDDPWKHVRVQLSPGFSAAKLRQMTSEMNACAALLIKNLEDEVDNKTGISVIKFTGAFAMDVIARTVFGLQVDSQIEADCPFVLHAKQGFSNLKNPNPTILLGIIFPFLRPLFYWLNVSTIDKTSEDFFNKVIEEAMRARKEGQNMTWLCHCDICDVFFNKVIEETTRARKEGNNDRVDFLQQMLKCNEAAEAAIGGDEGKTEQDISGKQHKKGLTHMQILANSTLFFIAAYDTTSMTLMYLLYNLALHPDCQQRVAEEINKVMGEEDEVKYEMLSEMTYLDKCIQETLRMYPPAVSVTRETYKDVVVNGVVLRKNTMVFIPIYVIHHDPEVWPEPDKFDPERFTAEAKTARNPFCYLPFGVGPHSCIGMRMAQQEMKIMMAAVLRRFRFVPCPQTPHSLTFKSSIILTPEEDILLAVERR